MAVASLASTLITDLAIDHSPAVLSWVSGYYQDNSLVGIDRGDLLYISWCLCWYLVSLCLDGHGGRAHIDKKTSKFCMLYF